MYRKFKLICWLSLCIGVTATRAQAIKQPKPLPRLLIIGSYFSGYIDGQKQQTYENLRAFIVNDSNDTLKFWGTNCRPNDFFSVTENNFMHLTDDECTKAEFEQMVIPPHRSLLVPLKLLIERQPHEIVQLKVSMKFYRWYPSDHFMPDRKSRKPKILSDKITLKYNKDGNPYSGKTDREERKRKEELNLPTVTLHLLTDDERKFYSVTADVSKITTITGDAYSYISKTVFRIPVTVHNNSDKMLKYYSMSCSWQEFYHIDNKKFEVIMSACDKNVPREVTVPAHSTHTDVITFYKNNNLKIPESFRLGLNINIDVKENLFSAFNDELRRYNIVWSNEVRFTGKYPAN